MHALGADPLFLAGLQRLTQARLSAPGWFASTYGATKLKGGAYFSMEFGLGEALPLYAGGLGILAGDYLKTASDLGVPVIGIGLRHQRDEGIGQRRPQSVRARRVVGGGL